MSNSFGIPQNDYSLKSQIVKPKYKFSKIYENAGQRVIDTTQQGQSSIFELPASACYNLSRSLIRFNMTVAAAGAARFNFLRVDQLTPIYQMQLYTRSGVYLCDLHNVDRYSKITLKSDTKIDEAEVRDSTGVSGRFGCINGRGDTSLLVTGNAAEVNNTTASFDYLRVGGDNTATPVMTNNAGLPLISISFDQFKNTIMALDKDLYFGEVLQLRIVWNSTPTMYFYGTAAGVPATGATDNPGVQPSHIFKCISLWKPTLSFVRDFVKR